LSIGKQDWFGVVGKQEGVAIKGPNWVPAEFKETIQRTHHPRILGEPSVGLASARRGKERNRKAGGRWREQSRNASKNDESQQTTFQ